MKTPINMIESIAADLLESTSLLEVIYRNNELPPEADNAIACLIRSMQKTNESAYEYVEKLNTQTQPDFNLTDITANIDEDIFDAIIIAKKLEELTHIYIEAYFTDKDNNNPKCYMSDVIHDYAMRIRAELEKIESKLN